MEPGLPGRNVSSGRTGKGLNPGQGGDGGAQIPGSEAGLGLRCRGAGKRQDAASGTQELVFFFFLPHPEYMFAD